MNRAMLLAGACVAISAAVAAGLFFDPAWGFAVAGFLLLGTAAVAMGRVRPLVAIPVVLGTAAGALVGFGFVRIACYPERCAGAEIAGAVGGGVLACAGLSVVVVLAVRSLDEHRAAAATGRRPATSSCEAGDCDEPPAGPGPDQDS
jgi:hypothetical protein